MFDSHNFNIADLNGKSSISYPKPNGNIFKCEYTYIINTYTYTERVVCKYQSIHGREKRLKSP